MDSCSSPATSTLSLLSLLLRSKMLGSSPYDPGEAASGRQLLREFAARELNALLWISLITVTAFLIGRVVKLFRLWIGGSRIPGPPSPSFYGHCKLISRENLTDVLSSQHKKYGAVVKLWLGPAQLLVSVKDPELAKEVLLKAEDKSPLVGKAFELAFGRSSLFKSSFNMQVQKGREALEAELNKRFHQRAGVVSTKAVDTFMEKMHVLIVKGNVNSNVLSQHMAFQMLGATVFGEAFLDWPNATVYEELLMSISRDACFWASYNITPFWRRGYWRYQCLCTKLKYLTQDIVQLCRRNYEKFYFIDQKPGKVPTIETSLACSLAMMPNGISFEEANGHMNLSQEPCANIMGVMFHGCLTTASLINNILARLALNPELQDKIYSEIVTARKGSQKEGYRNVDEMDLLLATVYESARLLSALPLLQRCSLNSDLHLKSGTVVPAGAVLVVPVQLVQMEGLNWGRDASEFNPYRFLSRAKKLSVSAQLTGCAEDSDSKRSYFLDDPSNNTAFLPFGSGRRACVGKRFTIHGVGTLLALMLEYYEIRLQQGSQDNLKPTLDDWVLQQLPSLELAFVKRNA